MMSFPCGLDWYWQAVCHAFFPGAEGGWKLEQLNDLGTLA